MPLLPVARISQLPVQGEADAFVPGLSLTKIVHCKKQDSKLEVRSLMNEDTKLRVISSGHGAVSQDVTLN